MRFPGSSLSGWLQEAMPQNTLWDTVFMCCLGPRGSQKQHTSWDTGVTSRHQCKDWMPELPCLGSRIDGHQSGKGFKGLPGCEREGWGAEGKGEPRYYYNRQIKSQGGGGFSRSSDLKVGEWKEEEAHLHRSSVRASSGRGSVLLALCYMQGNTHT